MCIFILDNGHGKETPGKCSPDKKLYEWKWTRDFVCDLYNLLLENGIEAHMLVPEEKDVSLKDRVQRVKEINDEAKIAGKTCFLISVHINAAKSDDKWHNASGFTVWVSKNASNNSKKLAKILNTNALAEKLNGNRAAAPDGYNVNNYYILKNTPCPAVLTENMFQDNKSDVEFLLSDKGQKQLLNLYLNAIKEYMK